MNPSNLPNIGKSKATFVDATVQWGLYFWRLPDGHLFTDGQGNMLNIPSVKGDLSKIAILRKAAAHYGQPDGEPWFYAGIQRATDEEYSEQLDRMKEGLIPTMNDIGAVIAAKQSQKLYGGRDD